VGDQPVAVVRPQQCSGRVALHAMFGLLSDSGLSGDLDDDVDNDDAEGCQWRISDQGAHPSCDVSPIRSSQPAGPGGN